MRHMHSACTHSLAVLGREPPSSKSFINNSSDGSVMSEANQLVVYPPIHRLGAPGRWVRDKFMRGK